MKILIKKIQTKLKEFEEKNIYHNYAINLASILITIAIFEIIFYLLTPSPNSLYPIQVAETRIVYEIQRLLGYPVEIKNEIELIYYSPYFIHNELRMKISTVCTGIHEIVFLSAMILGFRGVKIKTKFRYIAVFGIFLFIGNLVRIIVLYPLAISIGERSMWSLHYLYWKYGHLIIIMCLFIIFVYKEGLSTMPTKTA